MKAAVRDRFGPPDVIEVRDQEPPELSDDGVLVRVHASSINKADWYELTGKPWIARPQMGLLKPRMPRLGTDFSGVVEAVGEGVIGLAPGDKVYGGRSGSFAELVVVKNAVSRMPTNLDFIAAATLPTGATTALQGLRDHAHLESGQHVLIIGASGGVGTFALQIAKALGAEVTAVCRAGYVEQARALGADHVFDSASGDFMTSGDVFDVVFDVAGSRPWSDIRKILAPRGIDVIVGAPPGNALLGPLGFIVGTRLASMGGSRRSAFFIARFARSDLEALTAMIEGGQVKPVVERVFPLDEIRNAFRAFGQGPNRAKTVIAIS